MPNSKLISILRLLSLILCFNFVLAPTKIYAADSWSTGLAGGTARGDHASVLYSGKIYSWGGSNTWPTLLNSMNIYDIATNTWSNGTSGGTARWDSSGVEVSGKIFYFGGSNASSVVGT